MDKINKRLEEINEELNREDITADEVSKLEEEVTSLEEQRKVLEDAAEKREVTLRKVLEIKDGQQVKEKLVDEMEERKMEKENIYSSAEYRSAYFKNLMGKELNDAEKRAMTTATTKGVPTSTADKIITALRDNSDVINDIDLYYTNGYLKVFAKKKNGKGTEKEEATNLDSQDFELVPIELSPKRITEFMSISGNLNDMSVDDFENKVVEDISGGLAETITEKIYAVMKTVSTKVIGEVTEANIFALFGSLKSAYAKKAKWHLNRATLAKVMSISNKSKNDLYVDGKILGSPISETDEFADDEIIFGNAKFIAGAIGKDITIEEDRVLKNDTHEWLGSTNFDCAMGIEEAFAKLASE